MKRISIILISVVVGLFLLSVVKDMVIKISVEKGVQFVTGLRLSTRSFSVGLLNGVVRIRDLKLYNPKGFEEKVMLDMPEIYVNYDLGAIIGGNMHLREVRLDLKEFNVIKNRDGRLNLDSLKVVKSQKEPGKAQPVPAKEMRMKIDVLDLKIGKATYKDYSGSALSVKEFNVNTSERYTDITNPYAVVSLIVVRAMANTTIAGLSNFNTSGLKGNISDTLASAKKIAGRAQETATAAAKQAQETAEKAREAVEEATGALKDVFKSPFGSSGK